MSKKEVIALLSDNLKFYIENSLESSFCKTCQRKRLSVINSNYTSKVKILYYIPVLILQNQNDILTLMNSNNLNENIDIIQYFINNQILHNETY